MPKISRTKDGCFGCRQRRKKCDLQRPKCKFCSKYNKECQYPTYPKQTLRSFLSGNHQPYNLEHNQVILKDYIDFNTLSEEYIDELCLKVFREHFFATLVQPAWVKANLSAMIEADNACACHKQVTICVGSAYLSKINPQFTEIARRKYVDMLTSIKVAEERQELKWDEGFTFSIVQLLLVRDSIEGTKNHNQTISHILMAYTIVCKILQTSKEVQRYERALLESFVYHYSFNYVFLDLKIPCPNEVFSLVKDALQPEFWSSTSVILGCIDGFALVAKASHLLLVSLQGFNEEVVQEAEGLIKEIDDYDYEHLKWRMSVNHSSSSPYYPRDIEESLVFSKVLSSSAKLMLLKVYDNKTKAEDPKIQEIVGFIIHCMTTMEQSKQFSLSLLLWPSMVCGFCCTKAEDRGFLSRVMQKEALSSDFNTLPVSFLRKCWQDELGIDAMYLWIKENQYDSDVL
ncbi:hypothetical protein CANTEDRAFT_113204 [Yamadazyma tenuis ATCC 10573]|uniref:Zn(2)-C6 fungal-type domain-containing protein n=1 Tax=Candida tenuis (strain ATCC 10573 / BCRC 21748 / CBS 615 / JCM 9827 / NBRC 10315 / NRRL Y-1498 / VKM Y-70) TaxID=590646 RepID=G3B0Q1_CANTC|nr:uncharacterized protein CANTEDRAFT_113204 [Yamadazyma tenuis ATCC 10573]XP_006685259.1 uncharacterized protein CANTEDRAFT_113204 [Yamadazyma tenuis ATCC 10573]EGV65572.1 hypothetical protein CANTEDRAFT_113204 [Yamadazyma tenuis ATCC 10573]EGV65573.1 hypothetical protein CANTEDRAFT_113204 [Yamadazyma tenuis ATCC 10573]